MPSSKPSMKPESRDALLTATATAALGTATLHAMATAAVRGETATGEAMESMLLLWAVAA
jgi:hypothetical protein